MKKLLLSACAAATLATASLQSQDLGGIDLNPETWNLETEGQGMNFDVPIDPAQLQNIEINDGLRPVIFSIEPVNLRLFLGIKKEKSAEQLTAT